MIRQAEGLAGSAGPEGQLADNHVIILPSAKREAAAMARTPRIETLLQKMRSQKRYASIEQARIITRSYQQNEDAPRILQRALALKAALE